MWVRLSYLPRSDKAEVTELQAKFDLDRNPSFPSHQHIPAKSFVQLVYKDVWFVTELLQSQ